MKEELLELKKNFFTKYPIFKNYFTKEEQINIENIVKENKITYEELYEELTILIPLYEEYDNQGKDTECAFLAQYICSYLYSIDYANNITKQRM